VHSVTLSAEIQQQNRNHLTGDVRLNAYSMWSDISHLKPDWEQLLAKTDQTSIFSTWEWLSTWWQAYGSPNKALIIALYSGSDLIGIVPLYHNRRRIIAGAELRVMSLIGDGSEDSCNLDIIARSGCEARIVERVLHYLLVEFHDWDIFELNTMPMHSPVAKCFVSQLRQRRMSYRVTSRDSCQVELPKTWEMYLAQLSKRERANLRQQRRHLERHYRVRSYRCDTVTQLESCLEKLFALHQQRWKLRGDPGCFSSQSRRLFYYKMASAFLHRGWLEFWLLDLDEITVACDFNFRYGSTTYALQAGFDPAYASESVGFLLKGFMLEQLIVEGVRHYDFLTGLSENKKRWCAQPKTCLDIQMAKPFGKGSLYLFGEKSKERGNQWLRMHCHKSAWNLLKVGKVLLRAGLLV